VLFRSFSAIINPPQAAILAIGAGEERVIVKDGQMKVANMVTITASFDHRAIDGAVGAEYLQVFKKLIENPMGLVL
jgi:pyruvate dehydrogenase E2 component (dihydrolipoamide acetyltransferase)